MPGIRAEIEVSDPPNCPLATLSASADGATATDVRWTAVDGGARGGSGVAAAPDSASEAGAEADADADAEAADAAGGVVDERFRTDADLDPDAVDADVEALFDGGERTVYGMRRSADDCVCTAVESLGVPVDDVRVDDGSLFVTLHLPDVDALREVVGTVRERASVRVTRLVHAGGDGDDAADLVPVDRSVLTDRQREVLETAHDRGYFEHPRESNATELAEALDVCPSTLVEHLSIAQGKILDELLADRSGSEPA
jgi:hypothetical protein